MSTPIPWVEKYRPSTVSQVRGEYTSIAKLASLSMPHLIFHGPSGTGKTSMAKAVATKIAKETIEVNASDYNGIDTIRNTIQSFCNIQISGLKIVILDECDWLSYDAQRALKNIIEKHSQSTRFILLCNNIQRLTSGLISRCVRFTIPA